MDVLPVELWLGVAEYQKWPQHVALELLDDELAAEFRAWYAGPSCVITINDGEQVNPAHKRAIIARYPSLVYRAEVCAWTMEADAADTWGARYVTFISNGSCDLHIHGPNHYRLTMGIKECVSRMHPKMVEVKTVSKYTITRHNVTFANDACGVIKTLRARVPELERPLSLTPDSFRTVGRVVGGNGSWGDCSAYDVRAGTHSVVDGDGAMSTEDRDELLRRGCVTSLSCSKLFLPGIALLHNVHTVRLFRAQGLAGLNLFSLRNARLLDLSGSDVTDVSALGAVPKLYLCGCDGVRDVSALGGVRELDLSWCANIRDVAALGSVRWLSLAGTNVEDVSALGAVHSLDLSGCYAVRDFTALGRNYFLDLSRTRVPDIRHLRGVHTLLLVGCLKVFDAYENIGKNTILLTRDVLYRKRQEGVAVSSIKKLAPTLYGFSNGDSAWRSRRTSAMLTLGWAIPGQFDWGE